MAKKQSFADKATKHKSVPTCPICGDPMAPTLVLQPIASSRGGYRMRETRVTVCKCNRKEIYG